jgi:hypothetical protein
MVFLNRGGQFEARPLPVEAQFSVAFGLNAADFDGDGREDLFLAQNFFGVDPESSRLDAGTGLILLGEGTGAFRALAPRASGISIMGEQRGSAVADFDCDGRMDLAVAQNAGPIRLFRNAGARPGVRLRLRAGAANPRGIGSVVRLRFADRLGPAREVHAGSGYWSQDSDVVVLAAPDPPVAVQVRWPGGRQNEWPWPSGARFVTVTRDGLEPSDPD